MCVYRPPPVFVPNWTDCRELLRVQQTIDEEVRLPSMHCTQRAVAQRIIIVVFIRSSTKKTTATTLRGHTQQA